MFRSDLVDTQSPSLMAAALATFTELTNVIRRQRGEVDIGVESLDECMTSTELINDILIGWCHVHGYAHLKLEGQLPMIPKTVQKEMLNTASVRLAKLIRSQA